MNSSASFATCLELPRQVQRLRQPLLTTAFTPTLIASLILSLTVSLTGCGAFPKELRLTDNAATVPAVRVVHRFEGSTRHGGIEAEVDQVRASGPQSLSQFDYAQLGGQPINGPATLQHSARVQSAHVAYNQWLFADRPVQLEWFAGLGYTGVRWQTTGTAGTPSTALPTLTRNTGWGGPMGGLTGRWVLSPTWALEARWWGQIERSLASGNQQTSHELALAISPVPALRVRLGFAERWVQLDGDSLGSVLTVKSRGPMLALNFDLP